MKMAKKLRAIFPVLVVVFLLTLAIGCMSTRATYDYMVETYDHHYAHPDFRIDDYRGLLESNVKPYLDRATEAWELEDMLTFEVMTKKATYSFYGLEWMVEEVDPIGGGGGGS